MVAHASRCVATVEQIRPLAKNTWAVRFHAPALAQSIVPGQFFMIRPEDGADPLLGRPFALFDVIRDSAGTARSVEFGFVAVGKLTTLMSQWKPGEQVRIWGPLGNGFPAPDCRHLICVAGGIGQTPFLAVAREALGLSTYGTSDRNRGSRPQTVDLLYGVRSREYLAGLQEFQIEGLNLQIATDDGSAGHHGFVTDLLRSRLHEERASTHVYCCGPEPMMHAVAEICAAANIPCWLSLETPMACGFGACFSCVTKVREPDGSWDYRRTCVEGPVFPAERLIL
ncbi:MAG: dihydroorotate dehydrogenase electron transfer subunit [Planctomycetaceae bacterium]|nr:dihydroorotate dehydrogenase electron transfer subunit [Planctomycetaceae bacterium]